MESAQASRIARRQPLFGTRSVDPTKMAMLRSPIPRKSPLWPIR